MVIDMKLPKILPPTKRRCETLMRKLSGESFRLAAAGESYASISILMGTLRAHMEDIERGGSAPIAALKGHRAQVDAAHERRIREATDPKYAIQVKMAK